MNTSTNMPKSVSPSFTSNNSNPLNSSMLPNSTQQPQHSVHLKQNSDITLDEQLVNSTLFNQSSRSRKPFNLTEYEITSNSNKSILKNSNGNNLITIPTNNSNNDNNSFDDLDAIEVLNLNGNNCNGARSIHSSNQLANKQFQQQVSALHFLFFG